LLKVEAGAGGVCLHVRGADLLDGTPVVDIKPYVPYADAIEGANAGFAAEAPRSVLCVKFSVEALMQLSRLPGAMQLKCLMEQLVALDPRPAYRRNTDEGRVYGMRLENYNLRWQVVEQTATIVDIQDQ
jgi:hypothetical protein